MCITVRCRCIGHCINLVHARWVPGVVCFCRERQVFVFKPNKGKHNAMLLLGTYLFLCFCLCFDVLLPGHIIAVCVWVGLVVSSFLFFLACDGSKHLFELKPPPPPAICEWKGSGCCCCCCFRGGGEGLLFFEWSLFCKVSVGLLQFGASFMVRDRLYDFQFCCCFNDQTYDTNGIFSYDSICWL